MKITIITLFPELVQTYFSYSIVKKAQEKGVCSVDVVNLRDFARDRYKTVDDRPFGGGAGMVLRVDILHECLAQTLTPEIFEDRRKHSVAIFLTSAKGALFSQKKAETYAQKYKHLVLICGHYEGVDERILDFIDGELCLGRYVLTGGEVAAMVIADAVIRLLPGVFAKDGVTARESWSETVQKDKNGKPTKKRRREHPQYTRPQSFMGVDVPQILLSGDHKKIEDWKQNNSK